MKELGIKSKDLIPITGSEGHVSSVLNGRRKITLDMAKSLSLFLKIPADIFINDRYTMDNYISEDERTTMLYLDKELDRSKERLIRLQAMSKVK